MADDQLSASSSKACKTSKDSAGNDINSVLPDEILEEILAKLFETSIARVGTICNKWKKISQSTTFINKFLDSPSHKSWYLMLTRWPPYQHRGHVYDRTLGKWRDFDIPSQIINRHSEVASSSGLICTIPDCEREVYVYNPITKFCRRLVYRPTGGRSWPFGLTMSIGRNPQSYTVAIMRLCERRGENTHKLAIDVYRSNKLSWETPKEVIVQGHLDLGSLTCIICDEVFYTVLGSHDRDNTPALRAYDLASAYVNLIPFPFPCRLKSSQVMNINGKLVIAAGVEKQSIGGISIFLLKDKELVEVATAPDKYCKRLDLHVLRSSSGFDETIYIWYCLT